MHLKAVKHILCYLKGTIDFGLVYGKGRGEEVITGFIDNDLAGDLDDRKSTSGITFYVNDCFVSWNSQKQKTVALSVGDMPKRQSCVGWILIQEGLEP
jgi:hypothetical protein